MDFISGRTVLSNRVEHFRTEPRIAGMPQDVQSPSNGRDGRDLSSLDDMAVVREAAAGSLPAVDMLVVRYREKALRLVISVLGPGADAEDVVQEIFIKIYLTLDRFRGDSSFSTYLYTATVNRCRDELRKSKIRKFFSFDDWFAGDGSGHPSDEVDLDMERDERKAAVQRAMKRLPTQTQMLLYLREIEDMSYKELAEVFETEIGTIKSRLARGRDRLREELLPWLRGE
jgi:RNA polymerase sigma-70 factor (ECF subfamily)